MLSGKFDPAAEAEVRNWIHQLLGVAIPENELDIHLKDGVLLCQLIQTLFSGTPAETLPPPCKSMKIKPRKSDKGAVQMENIEIFLKAAANYGVQQSGLFACNDLFDGKNIPMVIATILQVGSEAQRNKFEGPTCGPRPLARKERKLFTRSQLRAGQTMIGLQSGTNKFASQKGMRIGAPRHVSDIKCDDVEPDAHVHISLQAGTNQFASQAGTRGFGAVRHISDIKADDLSRDGQSVINIQMGSNQYASQKGMTGFGAVRHIADIKADDVSKDSMSTIILQSGTNKFASQKGMKGFGAVRHIADIKADDVSQEGMATIGLQSGTNKFASQSGMTSFGAQRHISDIKVRELCDELECLEDPDEEYEDYN